MTYGMKVCKQEVAMEVPSKGTRTPGNLPQCDKCCWHSLSLIYILHDVIERYLADSLRAQTLHWPFSRSKLERSLISAKFSPLSSSILTPNAVGQPKWPTIGCIWLLGVDLHRTRGGSELPKSRYYLHGANLIFQLISGAACRCRGRDIRCPLCIAMSSWIILYRE